MGSARIGTLRTFQQARRYRRADGQANISPMIAPPTIPVSLPRRLFSTATCIQRSVVSGRHSGGHGEGTPNSSKSRQSIFGRAARNPGRLALSPEPLAPLRKNICAAFVARRRASSVAGLAAIARLAMSVHGSRRAASTGRARSICGETAPLRVLQGRDRGVFEDAARKRESFDIVVGRKIAELS
jgi:hypothetical protein